jgi:hypothetical protein
MKCVSFFSKNGKIEITTTTVSLVSVLYHDSPTNTTEIVATPRQNVA